MLPEKKDIRYELSCHFPFNTSYHTQEPHPADDLNGFDVARKLTILSRTVSHSPSSSALPKLQSFTSVQTTSLIPPELENIPTGDEFISRLPEFDAHFAEMRTAASSEGQVLRFVGVVDVVNGQVRAGLEKYGFSYFPLAVLIILAGIRRPILSRLHLEVRTTLSCSIPNGTAPDR